MGKIAPAEAERGHQNVPSEGEGAPVAIPSPKRRATLERSQNLNRPDLLQPVNNLCKNRKKGRKR